VTGACVRVTATNEPALPAAAGFAATLTNVLARAPALRVARARATLADAEARLADAARWSDVAVGIRRGHIELPRGERETSTLWGGALAVDLPLWNRGQGDVAAARASGEAAAADAAGAGLDVTARLAQLLADYEAARAAATAYAADVVPLADRQLALVRAACDAGTRSRRDGLAADRQHAELLLRAAQSRLLAALALIQLEQLQALGELGEVPRHS
jgi:cobalt-zinc-cadmium efflux system outer membrane protein